MAGGSRASADREDLGQLLTAAVVVPATWLLFGWRPGLCVSGYDGLSAFLPMIAKLVAARGDWLALAYRPDLLGGAKLRDTLGAMPLLSLLAQLGVGATGIYNATVVSTQVLLAFFSARAASDLVRREPARRPAGLGWRVVGVWLAAFAPCLGWRAGYGHVSLLVGLLPFLAGLALLLAAAAGSCSITLVLAATLGFAMALSFVGHQMVLYGLVFGSPILVGAWLARRAHARGLLVPALTAAAGLTLALPALVGLWAHALGDDSIRRPGQTFITYSYLTAGVFDWASCLPWGRWAIPPWRPALEHHETNVPLGPLLLLLTCLPWVRLRPLAIGLCTSVGLVLTFSMNIRPLSDLQLVSFPPLRSFRVPTRAALVVALLLPILVLAAVDDRRERLRWRHWLAGGAGAAALFCAPPFARDLLGFALAGAWPWLERRWRLALPLALCVVVLAGGGLGAFRERLLPFVDGDGLLEEAAIFGRNAVGEEPTLASPLVRALVEPEIPELGANTGFAAGLGSLDGYGFPQRRFVALVRALRGQPYHPSALVLRFHEPAPSRTVLFQLYDVGFRAARGAGGRARVETLGPVAGAAWFTSRVALDPDYAALARALLAWGEDSHARARETLRALSAEPAVAKARLPSKLASACASAEVLGVAAPWPPADIVLRVSTGADCPLVIATNYAEDLRAVAQGADDTLRGAAVFPAYGALAGVLVPAGTRVVRLETGRRPSVGGSLALGATILLVAVHIVRRARA